MLVLFCNYLISFIKIILVQNISIWLENKNEKLIAVQCFGKINIRLEEEEKITSTVKMLTENVAGG